MKARRIAENVFWVGAVDWDRRLFDSLIPLPDGTSYNAYLVRGSEKTALIDTVDPTMSHILFSRLDSLDVKDLDYIIANHAEQDHSGTLPVVLEKYPNAKLLVSPKAKQMLVDLLQVQGDRILTVEDGEKLSLGDKTLEFVHTPWVHWPETMSTYLHEDKTLFSGDFFGSHVATSDLLCDDDWRVVESAKGYYAEIMMPFRAIIRRNMERISAYQVEMIAPSHGPIHNPPASIMAHYKDWVSDRVRNEVVIPYVSMHGSTQILVDYLAEILLQNGTHVKEFNLIVTDLGKLATALVDAATIVIGSPTVLAGAHPQIISAVFLTNALRPKIRYASIIGSYGWGGKTVEQISGMLTNLKVELLEPVLVKGMPKGDDFAALDKLAQDILTRHQEIEIQLSHQREGQASSRRGMLEPAALNSWQAPPVRGQQRVS